MLAHALHREHIRRNIPVTLIDRAQCDIARADDIVRLFDTHRPAVIYNAAAYTNVNGAEENTELANAVNGTAVGLLAEQAKAHSTYLAHYSTDFVFDGTSKRPYLPTDPTAPLSAYGRSKLLGETLLQAAAPARWLIIRTAWLFGHPGKCFPRMVIERAHAGKPLRVVNDQIGCPTLVDDLAAASIELVQRNAVGIFHGVNAGQTSWYDFTAAILRAFHLTTDLAPITSAAWKADHPGDAHRPAYSVLDRTALEQAIGRKMRPWQEALETYRKAVQAGPLAPGPH